MSENLKRRFVSASLAVAIGLSACQATSDVNAQTPTSEPASSKSVSVKAEVWVDNWFAMHVNGAPVLEDSTPFKTERSFNSDSAVFDITLPATVALEFRDFYENDTGLEYIGSRRQQMGDGGAIAQLVDISTGQAIFATNESLRCTVIHRAPLDKSCSNESNPVLGQGACQAEITAEPEGWRESGFDDSSWSAPVVHSERSVYPKPAYFEINWDSAAELIWSNDLERDNVLLCRGTIGG